MDAEPPPEDLAGWLRAVERFDELADTADLMGDPDGAHRLRAHAARCQDHAMRLLDG